MLDRKLQPQIEVMEKISITPPQRKRMPNGSPLTIIDAGSQEVVRIDILIGAGRWQQTQLLQTLFTNRMMREGTKRFTSAQIAERLDYYGAWLELSSSMEHSYITLYSLNKYLACTLEIVESIVKEPIFPEKELHTVLEMNKHQFLVNSTKVDFIAQKSFASSIFGLGHPCGLFAEEYDYDRVTVECLKEYYQRYFHSNNCSIYVSGKITEEVLSEIEIRFGRESWGNTENKVSLSPCKMITTTQKRVFTEQKNAMQSAIRMGKVTLQKDHPDYLKVKILVTLFGGYFGSRLMSNIREDKGYTYGISAGIVSYPDASILQIATEAANEYVEDIIKEVYHEMKILQTELVTLEELTMVKNYMLGEMCRSYEGPFSLSESWIFIETSHLSDSYFERALEAVQTITAEEIRSLAQTHFCTEEMVEVVVGKQILNDNKP